MIDGLMEELGCTPLLFDDDEFMGLEMATAGDTIATLSLSL